MIGFSQKRETEEKNMKKKLVSLLLCGILALSMVACGSSDQKQTTNGKETESTKKEKVIKSLSAAYTGSTKAGTVLDVSNMGILVTATYEDGTSGSIERFTIPQPATLSAEQESSVTIKYGDASCVLTVKCTTPLPETFKSQCKNISYDDLARTPDSYTGQNIKFTGKIIQVVDNGTSAIYRINVTQGDYEIWEDTVLVSYVYENGQSRFLEDDIVTFYGEYAGLTTYTSTMGGDITIPSVSAAYIDLN